MRKLHPYKLNQHFIWNIEGKRHNLCYKIKKWKIVKKMEEKEIGTVEPIGGVNGYNFILGAISKYGDDISYHNSLLRYIEYIATINDKK